MPGGLNVECLAVREICSIVHDVAHVHRPRYEHIAVQDASSVHPPTQSEATTDKTGRILQEALDPSS